MIAERQIAQWVLAGLCASLIALLIYISAAPLPEFVAPTVQLPPRRHLAIQQTPYAMPPPDAFAEIDARPMFNPSRQPIAAPSETQINLKPPDVTLVGVILDPAERMAIIRTPASPLAVAFRQGASISGWLLREIAPDRVVLSNGSAMDELRLETNKATASALPLAQQAAQ